MAPAEQDEFLNFVEVQGGKNRDELHGLLKLVLATFDRKLSREEFFAVWKGNLPYDANLLRKRMTALKKLLEAYLATDELLRNPLTTSIFLTKAMQQRGWTEFIAAAHKNSLDLLDGTAMDDHHFGLAVQIEESYLSLKMEAPRKWSSPTLQRALDYTDLHYLVQKLRYACAAFNHDRIVGTAHRLGLLEPLLAYIAENEKGFPPLVRLYYRIYRMLTEPENAVHFTTFEQDLKANAGRMRGELARELYKYAINHCIARITAGEKQFADEIRRIYQETLPSGILLTNGTIEGGELKNIIAVILQTGDITLAETLLEDYGPKLAPNSDPAAITYHQALIHYHKGEFSTARRLFDQVLRDGQDVFYMLDARVCLWRASYELGDWDFSMAQYDAFRMYLKRTQNISKSYLAGYQRFANYFFALIRIITKYPVGENAARNIALQKLWKKLNSHPNTAHWKWLKKKIEEALAA